MLKINSLLHEQKCYYSPEWTKKHYSIITPFKLLICKNQIYLWTEIDFFLINLYLCHLDLLRKYLFVTVAYNKNPPYSAISEKPTLEASFLDKRMN